MNIDDPTLLSYRDFCVEVPSRPVGIGAQLGPREELDFLPPRLGAGEMKADCWQTEPGRRHDLSETVLR